MKKLLLTVFMLDIVGMASADIIPGKTYRIASAANEERVMFVDNSSFTNNTPIIIWTDTEVPAQQWEAVSNDNGTFSFRNVFTGKYLARNSALVSTNSKIQQAATTSSMRQWNVEPVSGRDGYYVITQSSASNTFILQTPAASDGASMTFQAWNEGSTPSNAQMWKFEEVEPISQFSDALRTQMMDAWLKQHLRDRGTSGKTFGDGGGWGDAEMLETVLDAYETTGREEYLDVFRDVFNYFKMAVGIDWLKLKYDDVYKWYGHEFNDDVMWMIIASARAYHLTGSSMYLNYAKDNFDRIYDRAYNQWGMMRWKETDETRNGTNSCINGPTEVAACYIAMGLTDENEKEEYYEIARDLYEKQRLYLFNPQTGEVYDSFTWNTSTNLPSNYNRWVSTYNQGTMLGAALMLYKHYGDEMYKRDAEKIVERTKESLCNSDGIIHVCQTVDGDLCGFKGVLMRYLRRYIVEMKKTEDIEWMKDNAFMAFNNRNSKGITSSAWLTKSNENWLSDTEKDGNGNYKSFANQPFGNSTAISVAFNAPLSAANIERDAYSTIEAENFNALRGVYVTNGTGGNESEISNIKNDYYTYYANVDFGTRPAKTVEIRVSDSSTANAKIEIRLGGTDGTLIGTADVPSTGGWKTVTANITPTDGTHDVYLVYKPGYSSTGCFNVDWFKFSTDAQPLPGDVTKNGGTLTSSVDGIQTAALNDNSLTSAVNVKAASAQFTYRSPIAVTIKGYSIGSASGNASADAKSWTLSASNDGESWTVLDEQTDQTFASRCQMKRYDAKADKAYTMFRLNVTKNNGASNLSISEWQLHGLAISATDITADGGTLSEGDKSVTDKNATTSAKTEGETNSTYRYNSKALYNITSYSITSAATGNAPKSWTLYGYENAEWTPIDSRSNQQFTHNGCTQFYNVTTDRNYQNFRLVIDAADAPAEVAELQLFGDIIPNGELYNDITDNGGTILSSDNADEAALRPLIDNNGTSTYTLPFDGEAWIEYRSEIPVKITTLRICSGHDTDRSPKQWTLQASDDGTSWTTLTTVSNACFNTKASFKNTNISNGNSYKRFRINFTQASDDAADALVIGDIQIHGVCISDNDIIGEGGTMTAQINNDNAGENLDKLYDSTADSKFVFDYLGNPWIKYETGTPTKANMYSITSANDEPSRDPQSWELQGSNNGRTWTTIDTRTGQSFYARKNTQFYSFDNNQTYNFYRLVLTENGGAQLAQMSEWQLFYSDKIATGIDDITSGEIRLNVYPNPVTDVLHVDMPADGTLTIYNTGGQAVASISLKAGENSIPFAQYGAGMYIVKAQAGSKTLTAKVIK